MTRTGCLTMHTSTNSRKSTLDGHIRCTHAQCTVQRWASLSYACAYTARGTGMRMHCQHTSLVLGMGLWTKLHSSQMAKGIKVLV